MPTMPNGASSAARSAPMLEAPKTEMPSSSASRISLCQMAAVLAKTPSTMAMARGASRRALSTSPQRAGPR